MPPCYCSRVLNGSATPRRLVVVQITTVEELRFQQEGYRHLELDERVQIEKGLDRGESIRSIARSLSRSASTISREVSRNACRPSNTSAAYTEYKPVSLRVGEATGRQYRASQAQPRADRRQQRCHRAYRMLYDRLLDWVITHLQKGWSPEEIAGRLPIDFPGDPGMRVCTETIYAFIYAPAQRHRQLWQYLTRGRKRRRRKGGRRTHSDRFKWRASIHDRPTEVEDRDEFGHWEADSVLGLRGTGASHTEVERVSRYYRAFPITSTTAEETVATQIEYFSTLPAHAVKSVTVDNGSEFAYRYKLADTVAVPTYFADPYSAYQRGSNEHFNGRLRRYFPKGTSFADLDTAELDAIITEINNRPRKVLGWATPAEVFTELCSTPDPTTNRCTPN